MTSIAGETGIAGPSIYDYFSGVDDIRFERAQRDRAEKSAVGDRGAAALQTLVDSIAECRAAGVSGSLDPYEDALAIWSASTDSRCFAQADRISRSCTTTS